MRNGMKSTLLAGGAIIALTVAATQATAGGFALREQSARGLGVSFAGAAAGGAGLSSMFWNPATITQYPGMTTSSTLNAIIPYAKLTPTAGLLRPYGSSGDMGLDAITANSASSYQFNNWLWFGLDVSNPFGLATKTPFSWAGQTYGRSSKVITFEATPTVGIKLNEMVSIGFGVRAMYFKTRLTSASGIAPTARSVELEGNDWAYGFTAGVNFTPFQGTDIGIGYRSEMKPKLEGTLFSPTLPGVQNIKASLRLPASVNVGLRQKINDRLTMLAGFEWTRWSTFGSFPVYITTGPLAGRQVTTLKFNYRNGWYASLGAEYAYNQALTLRAGVAYEKSPVTDAIRSVRLPDSDRIWTSVGFSYKWNQKLTLDASYAHLFAKKGNVAYVPGHQDYVAPVALQASGKAHVDIVSLGLTYRWDDPAVVKGDLPLVRKY